MQATDKTLRVASLVAATEAEGPGKRFAVWLQGCPLRCPGCCNPEMLRFDGGDDLPVEELLRQVRRAAERQGVEGVTLLGGEPFAHADAAAVFAREVQQAGLTVMVFSGYTLAELQKLPDPAARLLLAHTDLLVDGPYRRELPETRRRWIGSSNQQIHFLSERYREDDPCWRRPNTLEIRFDGKELLINGFPAESAAAIWKQRT
ncbi:MAG: 4Fe-4S single cluster domain-containing protein [Pirellulaceae bacterium]